MPRMTERDQAWCAMRWHKGDKQRELAEKYDFSSSVPISLAINAFLSKYSGNGPVTYEVGGVARKELVPKAMARYMAATGVKAIRAIPTRRKSVA